MARTQECEHTEQFIICPQCDEAGRQAPRRRGWGSTLVARYHAPCPECGEDVYDEEIMAVEQEDGTTKWVHRGGLCAEADQDLVETFFT